jgi:hypothetical protein
MTFNPLFLMLLKDQKFHNFIMQQPKTLCVEEPDKTNKQ